jgi:MSHA biogenesis protein MshI
MFWPVRKKTTAIGLLGIEVGPEGIALARVVRMPGAPPRLLDCVFRKVAPAQQANELKSLVAELSLTGMPVNLLLHPSDYKMLLLESPDVPAEELRDAIRWRVKDLVAEPLDQSVIDAFMLPADAYRGRSRMAYCAILDKARMRGYGALIEQAGLTLNSIDVTAMAFRNLGLLFGAEDLNIALLRLRTSQGFISVQHGSDLCMARSTEHGLERGRKDFSSVTLEIQRSLDYFESQLGKGYIHRLVLLPMKRDADATLQALIDGLAVKVQMLDLRKLFVEQPAADLESSDQAYCVAAVGAALRQEAG